MSKQTKHLKLKKGIDTIKQAIEVRAKITELYRKYHEFSGVAGEAAGIRHFDFKRAVDAVYYLGGGWPSENSKGRMEALLDNFVGMYRVLSFIGRGDLVTKHLAQYGITIKLDKAFQIDDRELTPNEIAYVRKHISYANLDGVDTSAKLVGACLNACLDLQMEICVLADSIKDGLKPKAQEALGVTDEEYDRIHDIVKFTSSGKERGMEKAQAKKIKAHESISNFNNALGLVTP